MYGNILKKCPSRILTAWVFFKINTDLRTDPNSIPYPGNILHIFSSIRKFIETQCYKFWWQWLQISKHFWNDINGHWLRKIVKSKNLQFKVTTRHYASNEFNIECLIVKMEETSIFKK